MKAITIALLLVTTVLMMYFYAATEQLEHTYPAPGPAPVCYCQK